MYRSVDDFFCFWISCPGSSSVHDRQDESLGWQNPSWICISLAHDENCWWMFLSLLRRLFLYGISNVSEYRMSTVVDQSISIFISTGYHEGMFLLRHASWFWAGKEIYCSRWPMEFSNVNFTFRPYQKDWRKLQLQALWRESNLWHCDSCAAFQPSIEASTPLLLFR